MTHTGNASELPEWGYPQRPRKLCNIERLVGLMEAQNLDGIVSYNTTNVFYLCGFVLGTTHATGEQSGLGAVVISRREPEHPVAVIKDQATPYFLSVDTWVEDVRSFGGGSQEQLDLEPDERPTEKFIPVESRKTAFAQHLHETYQPGLVPAVVKAMRDLGLVSGRVGFDNMSFAGVLRAADVIRDLRVVDVYALMKSVRAIKTVPEVQLLREATHLNQLALERSVAAWTPGMTWQGFNHTYHMNVSQIGGYVHPSAPMALANERGGQNISLEQTLREPDYVIEKGTNLLIDAHGTWQRYCWDGGKTWVVGDKLNEEGGLVASACGTAIEEILNALRPGASIRQLQSLGRDVFRKIGVGSPGSAFIYFHAMGLEHGERQLAFEPGAKLIPDYNMAEGMVMATHVMYPGDDDVRHWVEDIALVTPHGGETFFDWGVEPMLFGE